MKKHFSFRQMPNVFTTVSRHCNGGRTGVGIDVNSLSPHSSKRGLGKVSTLLLLFALSFGFSQEAWANETYVIGGATSNPKSYGNIGMNLGYKPKGWDNEQYKGMDKAQITFEGKYLFVTSYETSSDGNKGKLWNLDFQLMSGSTWNEQWGAIEGEADAPSNLIYDYDNHSWYSKLSIGGNSLKAYVYFDATTWESTTPIKMVVAHANYQRYKELSHVDGTNLYYISTNTLDSWTDAMGWGIVGGSTPSDGSHWINDIDNAASKTGLKHYGLNNENTYFVTPNGSHGEEPQVDWQQNGYSDFHYDQKIYKVLGTTTSSTDVGTISVSTYKLDGHGNGVTSSATIATNNSEATASAVKTATVTLTASANSGYQFDGWAESATGTIVSTDETFTYSATEAKTYYARFSIKSFDVAYTTNDKIDKYSARPTTAQYNSTVEVTATAIDKYVITGMTTNVVGVTPTCTSGLNTQTATFTFTMPDSDIELTLVTALGKVNLNFGAGAHGSLVAKIDDVQQTTGTQINGGSLVDFTATPNPNPGYEVEGWYKESTFDNKIDAYTSTTRQVKADDDVNVYVQFKETDYNITLSKGTGISAIKVNGETQTSVTAHVDTETAEITAVMEAGYNFANWETTGSITATPNLTTNGIQIKATSAGNLTAKTTEIPYAVTIQSNDNNKGTVSTSGVTAYVATASASITATPQEGYYFTGWTLQDGVTLKTGSLTDATITVNATTNGTITANFAERWGLIGSRTTNNSETEGMPGWTLVNAQSFTKTNDAFTTTVTLYPNREYKYMVLDRAAGIAEGSRRGADNADNKQTKNTKWTLTGSHAVKFITDGYGTYTITVNGTDGNGKPEVSYSAPTSYQITMGTKTFSNDAVSAGDGGTITAKTTENEIDFDVTTEQYVRNGGSVVFTATHAEGYSFAGFYSDAACTNQITTGVTDNIYTTTITDATFVYAKFTENLTTVVIDWEGDGKVQVKNGNNWIDATKGVTFVQAGVYTHPDVKAVLDNDKSESHYFAKWIWNDNADFEAENWDEKHAETKVIGFGTGLQEGQVLTANFVELDKIYFWNIDNDVHKWKNEVHVFFNVKWNNDYGVVPSGCDHFQMQQIPGTDYWWAYIKRYVYNEGRTWSTIAFADANMSGNEYFNNNNAVYRYDYNPVNNMYVPKSRNENLNGTGYFSEGYWMNYDGYQSGDEVGYELWTSSGASKGAFVAVGPNEARVDCRIDEISDSKGFYITTTKANVGYGTNQKFTSTSTSHALSHYLENYNFNVQVDAEGDYSFTLKMGEGTQMILEVGFPVGVGDYRVAWTDGSSKKHYSDVVKSNEASEAHTLSMYLKPSEGNLKLQKCTGITDGVPQWSEGTAINWTNFTKDQGVYQFDITINGDDGTASNVGLYTGNYYIKTDGVKGGWGNYKENIMDENTSTFSTTDATTYDRYYCQWISNEGCNVKCVIANDYCNALSDTLRGDDYTEMSGTEPLLPKPANVRFSYNTYTNTLSRAYISGSTNDEARFLMLINTNHTMYDLAQTPTQIDELKFTDKNNWVYQADIKAQPGCAVKLTANYDGKVQYFIGANGTGAGSSKTIINSSTEGSTTKYTMRVVYDFKTNRLVAGWIPSNTAISEDISLGGDMLITRTHQDSAQQIIFGGEASISDIHHVYGVLTLQRDVMTNANTMQTGADGKYYENNLYWISFPFNVKISEIFGVDGYGTKWILQKYRGDRRAEIGWFAETATFWEYMSASDTLKAYEGYVLCLDPDYFNPDNADVWKNSATEANFYFPSADGKIGLVNAATFKQSVPAHECKINRTFDADDTHKNLNHTETDSHWNVIGVPAFQNASASTINPTDNKFKSFYEWDPKTNGYKVKVDLNSTYRFKTMHAYMVQFAGDITWENVSVVNKYIPTSVASRRLEETAHYMAEIEFHQGNKANDHTYINLAENATTDFMLNEDMMKIDNAGCPNIYSFAGNYNVAYNETSKASQTIDLGVSAPAAGNYKFHMPSDFTGTVTLIDNVEQTRTDLQVQDYELYLDKGTYNDRFQLEINLQSVVTNLDNVFGGQVDSDHAVKFIRDDKMFILRSGSIFDATGKRMK